MIRNKGSQRAGKGSLQLQIGSIYINADNNDTSSPDEHHVPLAPLDLEKLEEINLRNIFNYSLMPWKRSHGLLFGEIFNTSYCIDSYIKIGNPNSDKKSISTLAGSLIKQRCIVLGDAGSGKSFAMRKICADLLNKGKHALYVSAQDWNNENGIINYVKCLLSQTIAPPKKLLIVLDGMDEVFATNHKALAELIDKANTVKCTIWLGCRTDFYDSAQCFDMFSCERVYLQEWTPEQSQNYVKEHAEKQKNNVLEKYLELVGKDDCIESFCKNPLRLSMLIYILETKKGDLQLHNNEYLLYNEFFSQWINNELRRASEELLDEKAVLSEWQRIARRLYVDRYSEVAVDNNSTLISILKVTKSSPPKYIVNDFLHRSFMEFLLAKEAIDAMLTSSQETIHVLKFNNRSDVDFYIKKAFIHLLPVNKNKVIDHLISAYKEVQDARVSDSEHFYVQNQIVYYLTRMNSKSKKIRLFIQTIYDVESQPIMKQGIAYGAATIGLLDIALKFAQNMDDPNSPENLTNRAWTLIFYGDQPDEDPLEYEDIHNAPWQRSKEARLRRLRGNTTKEQAFRMFDLCILHGFYESRGWHELSAEDLDIIKATETDIKGYRSEVIAFLEKKKQDIISKYNEYHAEHMM